MKKLISLLLALACLLSLSPVVAEEEAAPAPAVNAPITLEAYQQAYETLIAAVVPDCTVTWSSAQLEDGSEAWMGIINDAFAAVMLLPVDGMVSEIAVLLQSDLTEDTLFTFLSMAGYAGAALLVDEETTPEAACSAFVDELYIVFSAMVSNEQPENIYGLPGAMSISAAADGSYQYYFILKLAE